MKILLINDYGTPTGGSENHILQLRESLRKLGHDARLFTSSANTGTTDIHSDYTCFGTTSSLRTVLQSLNPWAYFKLRSVLSQFQPDLVYVNIFLTQLSPIILPLLNNIPSFYHVVWYRPICFTGTKFFPNNNVCNTRYGLACYRNNCVPIRDWIPLTLQMIMWKHWRGVFNKILANSSHLKDRLEAEGFTDVDVIEHHFQHLPDKTRQSKTPTVTYAGRLVKEKGVDILLRGFTIVLENHPQCRLQIAGEGPEHNRLTNLSKELGISENTEFLGHVSHRDIDNRLGGSWIQVVPSIWEEPFGMVAVESMLRGTTVIASSTGGLKEIIIHEKTGLLVPPGDVGALARAMIRVITDHELRYCLSHEGKQFAISRFKNNNADILINLYESLYNNSPTV